MGITLVVISKRHEKLVLSQAEMQAKALFQQVVITRRWIADHGGVFVEKLPWVKPNPYLPDSLIKDEKGKWYVKENPAMVTKQLSQYAQKEGLYLFHITSLKLLNPENAPDDFERKALQDFEAKKLKDSSKIEKIGSSYYFRYIAPLYVEKACLPCHYKQGYKVGDIRGAISVSVPMDYVFNIISSDRKYMILGSIITVAVLIAVLFMTTRRLVINPINKLRTLMFNFAKDGNPNVPVLTTNDELEDLSRAFADMTKSISDYHTCLQDRINAATRELVAKNETLLRSNKTKSDFIANISHELRTPLTSIKGAMDYLSVRLAMHKKDNEEDLKVFFEVIKKNAERLIRLVNNVLDYERIELGELEMHFKEINLKNVFDEVITGFRPMSEEKKVNIELKAEDVTVHADEDRIKQVLTNLLSNALNFSPESSDIIVTLTGTDGYANASVEDSGCGIAESEKELIFKQFYSKGVKNGTGLGLAICKGIIEAHNGEISVKTAEGKGSRFWFTIPKTRKEVFLNEKAPACSR
jgi:signal transduction histidine kinase